MRTSILRPAPQRAIAAVIAILSVFATAQAQPPSVDAVASEASLRLYASLADQGLLKQRVRACTLWMPGSAPLDSAMPPAPLTRANLYARERVAPDGVKLMLDGVPTDGHTAAMLEPYADASLGDEGRERGLLQHS